MVDGQLEDVPHNGHSIKGTLRITGSCSVQGMRIHASSAWNASNAGEGRSLLDVVGSLTLLDCEVNLQPPPAAAGGPPNHVAAVVAGSSARGCCFTGCEQALAVLRGAHAEVEGCEASLTP